MSLIAYLGHRRIITWSTILLKQKPSNPSIATAAGACRAHHHYHKKQQQTKIKSEESVFCSAIQIPDGYRAYCAKFSIVCFSFFLFFFFGLFRSFSLCFSLLQKTQISSKKKEKEVWVKWKSLTDQSRSCRLVVGPNEKWIADLSVLSHRNWLQVSELQRLSPFPHSKQNKTKPSCSERSFYSSIPCLLDTYCERKMLLSVLPWTSCCCCCCFLSKDSCFFSHKDFFVLLLLVLGCRDRLLVLVLVATWFWVLGIKARVFQTVLAAIYPSCLFLCLFVCFLERCCGRKTGRVVETGSFTYPIALLLEKSFWNEARMAAAAGQALMVMVMMFHVWLEPLLVLVLFFLT